MPIKQLEYNSYANHEDFMEDCYKIYKRTWENNPKFNFKVIQRKTELINEKETSFWDITEGHNDSVIFEHFERYIAIPFFEYILVNTNSSGNGETDDIIWYTVRRTVNIISKKYNYLIVVSERKSKCFLITAYPISENKKLKKIKDWYQAQRYKKTEAAKTN